MGAHSEGGNEHSEATVTRKLDLGGRGEAFGASPGPPAPKGPKRNPFAVK